MKCEKVIVYSTFGDLLQSSIREKYKNAVVYSKTFPQTSFWWFRDKVNVYVFKRPNWISSPKMIVSQVSVKFPTSKVAKSFCKNITDKMLLRLFNKQNKTILYNAN